MRNSPCYGCDRRTSTCHGTCKEYADWTEERNAMKEKKDNERVSTTYECKRIQKLMKRRWPK